MLTENGLNLFSKDAIRGIILRLYTENHEGIAEYNIDKSAWDNRKPGLSAMIRLANEEEWIRPTIESIIGWHDEIVCTLQCSTDKTEEILRGFNSPKIKIYQYPFKSWPGGPGYDKQIRNSVHHKSYFCNWSLALTTRQWVSQWDGDMVAHDWLGNRIRAIISENKYSMIYLRGINIVHDLIHKSMLQPVIIEEQPRFFLIKPNIYYVTGSSTHRLHCVSNTRGMRMEESSYLHFKWAKNWESAHMSWPENWEQMSRFIKINERAKPGEKYNGSIPKSLKKIMDRKSI